MAMAAMNDADSSSDDLGQALADALVSGDDGAEAPALVVIPPRKWRKNKLSNASRKEDMAARAVMEIQHVLGRKSSRQKAAGRRPSNMGSTIASSTILDMCFGAADRASADLPSAAEAGARAGLHAKTARRTRSLVLDCLLLNSEKRMEEAWSRVTACDTQPVGVKFQWDETALKLFLPRKVCERLFPFSFEEQEAAAAQAAQRRKKGSGAKPSYTVQIMQAQGAVKLGSDSGILFVPAKVVHSTSAADLAVPIRLFLPIAELESLPLRQPVIVVLSGDSFKPNKLIIRHIGERIPHPVHDGLCFGRFM